VALGILAAYVVGLLLSLRLATIWRTNGQDGLELASAAARSQRVALGSSAASVQRPPARTRPSSASMATARFQMTLQELTTSLAADLPVVVGLNNGQLGTVHQWQSLFYAERLSQVDLRRAMPDFAAIARGYGALRFAVRTLGGGARFGRDRHQCRPACLCGDPQRDPGDGCV